SVELRETPDIGIMHNDGLTTYYAEFGTELDSILYFNSRKDTLLTRLVSINEQLGYIDNNATILLSNMIDNLFCLFIGNLSEEENYKRLVQYQYENLMEECIIDEHVAAFIYCLTINSTHGSEVSDMIN